MSETHAEGAIIKRRTEHRHQWVARSLAVVGMIVIIPAVFLYGSQRGSAHQKTVDAKSIAAAHTAIAHRLDGRLTIVGDVISITTTAVQINTSTDVKTCLLTSETAITALSHSASTAAPRIQAGERVTVSATQDSNGTITAQRIRIL